jgi:hypothetical protein
VPKRTSASDATPAATESQNDADANAKSKTKTSSEPKTTEIPQVTIVDLPPPLEESMQIEYSFESLTSEGKMMFKYGPDDSRQEIICATFSDLPQYTNLCFCGKKGFKQFCLDGLKNVCGISYYGHMKDAEEVKLANMSLEYVNFYQLDFLKHISIENSAIRKLRFDLPMCDKARRAELFFGDNVRIETIEVDPGSGANLFRKIRITNGVGYENAIKLLRGAADLEEVVLQFDHIGEDDWRELLAVIPSKCKVHCPGCPQAVSGKFCDLIFA